LFPKPKVPSSNDKKQEASIIQNGAVNLTASGGRKQIVFGRGVFVGSQVISAAANTNYKELDEEDDSN